MFQATKGDSFMKKREKKMQLHRETVLRLSSRELDAAHLANAQGGALQANVGVWTSCIEPNCCGTTVDTQ
jgi:hypothetical protein